MLLKRSVYIIISYSPIEEDLIHRNLTLLIGQELLTVHWEMGERRLALLLLNKVTPLSSFIVIQKTHSPGKLWMLFMVSFCLGCITVASVFSENDWDENSFNQDEKVGWITDLGNELTPDSWLIMWTGQWNAFMVDWEKKATENVGNITFALQLLGIPEDEAIQELAESEVLERVSCVVDELSLRTWCRGEREELNTEKLKWESEG